MHILPPHINNIGNTKKKPSAKQQKSKKEHDAYLRKMGVHPDQLALKNSVKKSAPKPVVRKIDTGLPCSNTFVPAGEKRSVFDNEWKNTYQDNPEMAERERIALAEAQAKKARVMPLFNKGGLQVITDGLKMTELGKRR